MAKRKLKSNRKPSGGRVFIRITIGLVLVVAMASAIALYFDQENQMDRVREERETLESSLAEAQDKLDELEALRAMVDTDEYIEKIARDQLGMVRPGEYIFED